MNDEFSEWDRFYEMYERSLTAGKAMKKYKKRRKSIEDRQARIDRLRHTIVQRTAARSSAQSKSEQEESSQTKTSPASDGTKRS